MATDLEVVKEHAQERNPELKHQVESHPSSVTEGVGGEASAWVAAERNRLLGRELLPEEKAQHADKEKAAKIKELDAWKKFDVFQLGSECNVLRQLAQT